LTVRVIARTPSAAVISAGVSAADVAARCAAETTPMAPVLTEVRNPRRLTLAPCGQSCGSCESMPLRGVCRGQNAIRLVATTHHARNDDGLRGATTRPATWADGGIHTSRLRRTQARRRQSAMAQLERMALETMAARRVYLARQRLHPYGAMVWIGGYIRECARPGWRVP
jgi:hypothetical protein